MAGNMPSPDYASAIASIESGGERDPYSAMGPATKAGDRAHGKYQILGSNIGPWSEEILGQKLTPEQFLSSPQAQDAVFQGKFSQYVEKYGPEGAAQAWIGGPGGVGKLERKDSLGTSIGAYGQKFMRALGAPQPPQPGDSAQPIPIAPQMPAGAVPSQPMPAYGFTPQTGPAGIYGDQPEPMAPMNPANPANGPPTPPPLGVPRRPPDYSRLAQMLQKAPAIRGLIFKG